MLVYTPHHWVPPTILKEKSKRKNEKGHMDPYGQHAHIYTRMQTHIHTHIYKHICTQTKEHTVSVKRCSPPIVVVVVFEWCCPKHTATRCQQVHHTHTHTHTHTQHKSYAVHSAHTNEGMNIPHRLDDE